MSTIPSPVHKPILGFVQAQLAINSAICLLVIAAVSLRVAGRRTGPGCGWDDWLVIAAVPLAVAMLVCQGLFAVVGNGYDLNENPECKSRSFHALGRSGKPSFGVIWYM